MRVTRFKSISLLNVQRIVRRVIFFLTRQSKQLGPLCHQHEIKCRLFLKYIDKNKPLSLGTVRCMPKKEVNTMRHYYSIVQYLCQKKDSFLLRRR